MRRTLAVFAVATIVLVCGYLQLGPGSLGSPDQPRMLPRNSLGYQLQSQACWFDADWRRSVNCFRLQTPDGFSLPVVVISGKSAAAPVLYLSGGPGDPAHLQADDMLYWFDWYDQAQLDGDLVLVDRRGTGLSRPHQDCGAYIQFSRRILGENVTLAEELRQGQQVLRQCAQSLAEEGFDARAFGTRQSAEDLRALMQTLNYPQWHLYGVSYGTRLGLELLERFPQQTLSAVLDSVYPKGKGSLYEWPRLLDSGLQRFFRFCEASECGGSDSQLEKNFWKALGILQQTPLSLTVKSWHGEAPFRVVVNDHRFLSAVFDALYDRNLADKIPAAIASVLSRDTRGLMPLIEPFVNYAFDPQFNNMVFMAIECAETADIAESTYIEAVNRYPQLKAYTLDLWRYDSCRDLNALGKVGEERVFAPQRLQAISHIPTLLLAGELDPITPSDWATRLHRDWPASQLLVFPDVGHSVVGHKQCVHSQLGAFFRAPNEPLSKSDCQFLLNPNPSVVQ